jgi:hypothetical protein
VCTYFCCQLASFCRIDELTDVALPPFIRRYNNILLECKAPSLSSSSSSDGHIECKQQLQTAVPPPYYRQHKTLKWQHVVTKKEDVYVFSAYYDRRWKPAVVLIIGLASEYQERRDDDRQLYCRMWFQNQTTPHIVEASFSYVPETHGAK